jgi:hypothetical protein
MFFPPFLVSAVILGTSLSFVNASLRGNHAVYHQDERASRVLEETSVGLYLIKDESHTTSYNPRYLSATSYPDDQTANLELPDGRVYKVTNAQAGWEECLESGIDEILIPAGSVISSNGKINVKGMKLSKVNGKKRMTNGFFHRNLQEDDNVRTPPEQKIRNSMALVSRTRKLQKGSRTVLAVRVILNDASYSFANQTGLSNNIFGNGIDTVNLKSQFAACSYNQLIFEKSANREMSVNPNDLTTAISNGVVDIKVNLDKSAGDSMVSNAVTAKINSVFGVSNPNVLADNVMYCYPSGVLNGIAYAYVNSWNSVYSDEWCNNVSAQMHEVC